MSEVRLIGIRNEALSVDELLAAVADPRAGGTCVFIGTVRETDHGKDVTALDYEAHPSVEGVLRDVAAQVAKDFPRCAVAAIHRVGALRIGDVAVVVAASAPHRSEAFDACRRLIDDLKREVPIWKHQVFSDGGDEWVGSP